MSRYFSKRLRDLVPYTPGEQTADRNIIKLNTNESPFPPSPKAKEAAFSEYGRSHLYPDPQASALRTTFARIKGVGVENVVFSNGSDDLLNFAFIAFCDDAVGAAFADITYGFYPVFADINRIDYLEIPLTEDLEIRISDYFEAGRTIFIANPNAPTGIALAPSEIEEILLHNKNNVVIVDEAYVDFGAESCIPLTKEYDNLLVVGTFSKSRSFAGGRVGYAVGSGELIRDLQTIRYSTNPYDLDRITQAAAVGILSDPEYMEKCCRTIMENREYTADELSDLGFLMTDSRANFLFAEHPKISGEQFYLKLKEKGILVRHFPKERIKDRLRITIGSRDQMEKLIAAVKEILKENESF